MEISVAHQAPQTQPWDRAFWKPVHGKEGVFAYLIVIHVLGLIGLILYPVPSPKILGISLLFTALGGLGTTVCYHRMLAHKTLRTNPLIEHSTKQSMGKSVSEPSADPAQQCDPLCP